MAKSKASKPTSSTNPLSINLKQMTKAIKKSSFDQLQSTLESLTYENLPNEQQCKKIILEAIKQEELDIFKLIYLNPKLATNINSLKPFIIYEALLNSAEELSYYVLTTDTYLLYSNMDSKSILQSIIDLKHSNLYFQLINFISKTNDPKTISDFLSFAISSLPSFNLLASLIPDTRNFTATFNFLASLCQSEEHFEQVRKLFSILKSENICLLKICLQNNFEAFQFLISLTDFQFYSDLVHQTDTENNNLLHSAAFLFFENLNIFNNVKSCIQKYNPNFPFKNKNSQNLTPDDVLNQKREEYKVKSLNQKIEAEKRKSEIEKIKFEKNYKKSISCDFLVENFLKENNLNNLIIKFGKANISYKNLDNLNLPDLNKFLTESESENVFKILKFRKKISEEKLFSNKLKNRRKKKIKKLLRAYGVKTEEELPEGVVEHFLSRQNRNNEEIESFGDDEQIIGEEEYEESLLVERMREENGHAGRSIEGIRESRRRRDKHRYMIFMVFLGYILFFIMMYFKRR